MRQLTASVTCGGTSRRTSSSSSQRSACRGVKSFKFLVSRAAAARSSPRLTTQISSCYARLFHDCRTPSDHPHHLNTTSSRNCTPIQPNHRMHQHLVTATDMSSETQGIQVYVLYFNKAVNTTHPSNGARANRGSRHDEHHPNHRPALLPEPTSNI